MIVSLRCNCLNSTFVDFSFSFVIQKSKQNIVCSNNMKSGKCTIFRYFSKTECNSLLVNKASV